VSPAPTARRRPTASATRSPRAAPATTPEPAQRRPGALRAL